MLTLRQYQTDMLDAMRQELIAGHRSVLAVAPTGAGKTVLIAKMLSTAASRGKNCWFTVPRRELLHQSVNTLRESTDAKVGIVASGFPVDKSASIQVCSVQSLSRRAHLLNKPDLIVVDECAHVAARTWSAMLEAHPGAIHIGITATPCRTDQSGLGKWFQRMVIGPSVSELIAQGYLSKYRMFAPGQLDLSGVHTVAGDYNKRELDDVMQKSRVTGDCLSHYKTFTAGKRAIVFAWSVEASEQIAAQFNEAGINARHIDGSTSMADRDASIAAFRAGTVKVLTNVDICGEGYDVPAIEAAFLLRPTQSLSVYLQQVGRALRPAPDKPEALIFDHSGNCFRHGLPDDPREWSLDGIAKPKGKQECPVRQCPSCYAVSRISATVCKYCGQAFPVKPRKVEQKAGELAEITKVTRREQGRASSYEDLLLIERQRGYKKGWAWYVWNSRRKRDGALKGTA